MNWKTINAIVKKELNNYFYSITAYVVIVLFLLILGWFFSLTLFLNGGEASMRAVYSYVPLIFLFFIPAITMKSIAEEKKSGTIELLVTFPIKDSEIIAGKFLSSLVLIISAVVMTFIYVITLSLLGNLDGGAVFCGYLGLILMGGAYAALGILASSMTDNQIVGFIVAFVFCFVLFIMDKLLLFLPIQIGAIIEYLSIDYHFNNISKGVVDSRDVIYYLSVIFLSLFFASKVLEKRKNA